MNTFEKKFWTSAIGVLIGILILFGILSLSGCNASPDMTFKFDRVIIVLPNREVVEGKCQSWTDFENSDMIQVKVGDKVYLTHSTNVVLISE